MAGCEKGLAEDGSGEEWLKRLQRKRTRGEKEKVGRGSDGMKKIL